MGKIEGNSYGRGAVRAEPFISQVANGLKGGLFFVELPIKILDARFEFCPGDFKLQIADPYLQKLFVREAGPIRSRGTLQSCIHDLPGARPTHAGILAASAFWATAAIFLARHS